MKPQTSVREASLPGCAAAGAATPQPDLHGEVGTFAHFLTVQARLRARNVDNGEIVADRVASATRRIDRAVGLLTRRGLEPGEALWIMPCRGVHTCGMRFAIDVVALDRSGTVVDLVANLRPWRIRLPRQGTSSVLELAAGSLATLTTKLGHRIALEVDHEEHEE